MKLIKEFRQSNRGASLVLVSAFCLIVLAIAVTLTIISSMLLSNAEKRNRQDQAYELATSMSARVEELILNAPAAVPGGVTHKSYIDLDAIISSPTLNGLIVEQDSFDGMPDSSVKAVVSTKTDGDGNTYYIVTVSAGAVGEEYICTTEYVGNAIQGYSRK